MSLVASSEESPPQMPRRRSGAAAARTRAINTNVRPSDHQSQYDDPMARFFNIFNKKTGRAALFWGFMEGHLANNAQLTHPESIAVDFGCGTGWLAPHLAEKFTQVYGIDTSEAMLKIAFDNTRTISNVSFHQSAPASILHASDLVTAVHVHYHFETEEKLRKDFFGAAAELLKPDGEMLLIGCPSDHIRKSPAHYYNLVKSTDIPAAIKKRASQISLIADTDGFVALRDLPAFELADGIQMKTRFEVLSDRNRVITTELMDTYWSDAALMKAAKSEGLTFITQSNMILDGCRNAYMVMRFRKTNTPALT